MGRAAVVREVSREECSIMPFDLLVRNACLARRAGLVDIGIEGGRFTRIAEGIKGKAAREMDVAGRLVSPPLVDCHVHLDALLTVGQPPHNPTGTLIEGIHIWSERQASLTPAEVQP